MSTIVDRVEQVKSISKTAYNQASKFSDLDDIAYFKGLQEVSKIDGYKMEDFSPLRPDGWTLENIYNTDYIDNFFIRLRKR